LKLPSPSRCRADGAHTGKKQSNETALENAALNFTARFFTLLSNELARAELMRRKRVEHETG
jgi:hypothetical protein